MTKLLNSLGNENLNHCIEEWSSWTMCSSLQQHHLLRLIKFDRDVVSLCDDDISEIKQYHSALRTLHSQAVVDTQSNFAL